MSADEQERAVENSTERLPLGALRPDDRGHDPVSEDLEESIGRGESRPPTGEEREAAARDPFMTIEQIAVCTRIAHVLVEPAPLQKAR